MAEDKNAPQRQELPVNRNQPPQGASAQPQPQQDQRSADASRKAVEKAQQDRRAQFDAEKKAVAERPQQSGNEGSKPTPTQAENDEIRSGLRHIDDKEDDGSGPDYVHHRVVRRVEADESKGKYETR